MPSPVGARSFLPATPGVSMCVRVSLTPAEDPPAFDADARVIRIPCDVPSGHTVTLVRAILRELIVEQPEVGAVCWCGEGVEIPLCVPHQRRSEQVVNHHGA